MSTDSTVREVFEDVEADPDAILEACDAETPAELVESGGEHDVVADGEAIDVTATELFADLEDETPTANSRDAEPDETVRTDETDDGADRVADLEFEFIGDSDVTVRDDGEVIDTTAAELGALTATDPTESVSSDPTEPVSAASADPDDRVQTAAAPDLDDRVETAASSDDGSSEATGSSGTLTFRGSDTADLELVGPDPTPTRITDDAFGGVGVDVR